MHKSIFNFAKVVHFYTQSILIVSPLLSSSVTKLVLQGNVFLKVGLKLLLTVALDVKLLLALWQGIRLWTRWSTDRILASGEGAMCTVSMVLDSCQMRSRKISLAKITAV